MPLFFRTAGPFWTVALPKICASLAITLLALQASSSLARAGDPTKATSSRVARREAIEALPIGALDKTDLVKVQSVIKHATIYRRMPTKLIDCDPHLFLFLVRHPEVVVNIWEVLGVSKVTLERIGEHSFRATDGQGSVGLIKVLYDEFDKQLVFVEGKYEGPLFGRPINTQIVLLLHADYFRETEGRRYVTARMDAFVHIERVDVELLAKTFRPLVSRAADYNFTETMAFVSSLSQTAERNPRGIGRIYGRLQNVAPETRQELTKLSYRLAQRSYQEPPLGRH